MSLSTVLLGVLADGPAHGYDLKRLHDERFPASKALPFGQVYSTLARLQRDELVEAVEVRQESGPERTVYALTDAGRAHLDDWLGQVEEPATAAADELVRKVITALHRRVDATDFLQRQRAAHMSVLRRLTAQRTAAADLGERIALDHAIAHLDAELRWLEETRVRAARPAPPALSAASGPSEGTPA